MAKATKLTFDAAPKATPAPATTTATPMATPLANTMATPTAVAMAVTGVARTLADQIRLDPADPSSVAEIGAAAQRRSAEVSDKLLDRVTIADAGHVGALLGELAVKCKSVDVRRLQPNWRDGLTRMPMVGNLFSRVLDAVEKHLDTAKELEAISGRLMAARDVLLQDAKQLDALFEQNQSIHRELTAWIDAGRLKLADLDDRIARPDPAVDAQSHRDLVALRERLDRHLHGLELTATIRLQNAPKIRIVQSGNLNLAEKLQSGVLNTVPLWKENLALAITQVRQAQAVALQKQVDDTTNSLLRASADLLHKNSVDIAKANSRGIVDVATLQHTQDKLLATIGEVRRITEQVAADRAAARIHIQQMATQLLTTSTVPTEG